MAKKERPRLSAPQGLHDPSKWLLGRRVYCGPWCVMALTGRRYEEVRAAFNDQRDRLPTQAVMGTGTLETRRVLSGFKVESLTRTCFFMEQGEVTLARWLRERTPEQRKQTFLLVAGHHWMLVRDKRGTCAITGHWTWVGSLPKRRAKVTEVYAVRTYAQAAEENNAALAAARARRAA